MPELLDKLEPQSKIAEILKPSYTLVEIYKRDDFSGCGLKEDLIETSGRLKVVVHPLHEKDEPRQDLFWKEETKTRYQEYYSQLNTAFKESRNIFLIIIGQGHEEKQKLKEFLQETNYQGKVYLIRSEGPDKPTPFFSDVSGYKSSWETFIIGLRKVGLKEATIMGTRLEFGGRSPSLLHGDNEWLTYLEKHFPSKFRALEEINHDPNRVCRGCIGAVARRLLKAGINITFHATFPDKSPYETNKQGNLRHMRTVK